MKYFLYRLKRNFIKRFLRKDQISSEISQYAFSTHLPVLVGLGIAFPVRSVLELGCGHHSTLTFLDKTIFSNLEILHSLENDKSWADIIHSLVGADPRLKLTVVDGAISNELAHSDFSQYDLVFIDDSISIPERVNTMRQIVKSCAKGNIFVAHDFEQPAYQDALRDIPNKYVFTSLLPNTAVLWKDAQIDLIVLKQIHALVDKYAGTISTENISDWKRIFTTELVK